MTVGIFEAPLIYSCAGNLQKVEVDYGTGIHFDPLCHSCYFRYYSGIEYTVIKDESVRSAGLEVRIPVRNPTICSSYVKGQDYSSTTTGEC